MSTPPKSDSPRDKVDHPAGLPHCILCGSEMRLSRIDPSEDTGYDCRTFDCSKCKNTVTAKIYFGGTR